MDPRAASRRGVRRNVYVSGGDEDFARPCAPERSASGSGIAGRAKGQAEDRTVALAIEALQGSGDRKPGHRVHFTVGVEHSVAREPHVPVPDDLWAAARLVPGLDHEAREPHLATGFFAHLAQRRVIVRFAFPQLALGERPVVLARTMHQRDAGGATVETPQNPTRGSDKRAHYSHTGDRA